MRILWLLFIIISIIPKGYSQATDSTITWKKFLSYNLNPGISFGVGGVRPMYALPTLSVKFNRFDFDFMHYDLNLGFGASAQVDVDLFQIQKHKTTLNRNVLLSAGYSVFNLPENDDLEYTQAQLLLGVNQYKFGTRGKWLIKAGVGLFGYSNRIDYNNTYYSKVSLLPYAELSYKLFAYKFERPISTLNKHTEDRLSPGVHSFLSFLGKNFNPFLGVGFGGGHAGHYSYNGGIKLGPVFISGSSTRFRFLDQENYQARTQVSVDLYKIPKSLLPNYQAFLTASWEQSNYYSKSPPNYPTSYYNTFHKDRAYLLGLNLYKINGKHSLSGKIGYSELNSSSSTNPSKFLPYGELSIRYHLFRFHNGAFVGYLYKPKNLHEEEYKESKRNLCAFLKENVPLVFNPTLSIGAGVNHALFIGPSFGVKFWRLESGFSVIPLPELSGSVFGDIELFQFGDLGWMTVGASGDFWDFNSLFSLHTGYTKYIKDHQSMSFKIGIGWLDSFESGPTQIIPIGDFSYHWYLFKIKRFKDLKK